MTQIYKKLSNGRYEPVGYEFTGFPANGYWVVTDGRNNLIAPLEHPRPINYLRFAQYQEDLVKSLPINRPNSLVGLIEHILLKLEELNYEHIQNEQKLMSLLTGNNNA
jgi:hypothetical protein